MPAARAAASREPPSSTSASASIRRAALASRHRPASRRRPPASSSRRVIAIVIRALPWSAVQPSTNRVGQQRLPTQWRVSSSGRWYQDQFGWGYSTVRKFLQVFHQTLGLVL